MPNRFGRTRPVAKCPTLSLKKYLKHAHLAVPVPFDYSKKATKSLRNIYLNDRLGCCVISGGAHIRGVTSGNADGCVTFTDEQITAMYSAIGGYVPGDESTDQGCDEQTAANYWTHTGFSDGVKLAGWLAVDPSSVSELQSAMYLFESLFFGIELPDAWINPEPEADGFVWDVAGQPNPSSGHCVVGVGANAQGIVIDTWGLLGTLTYPAIAQYCADRAGGNVYVFLSPDSIASATGKSPTGVDWSGMVADFNAIGAHIPVPVPVTPPTPTPGPTPIPVPTPAPTPLFTFNLKRAVKAGQRIAMAVRTAMPAGTYGVLPMGLSVEALVEDEFQGAAVPAGMMSVNWQQILSVVAAMVHRFGPPAVPLIEQWIATLPLTLAQQATIDAILQAAIGG